MTDWTRSEREITRDLARIVRCTGCGEWTWVSAYELVTGVVLCGHLTEAEEVAA